MNGNGAQNGNLFGAPEKLETTERVLAAGHNKEGESNEEMDIMRQIQPRRVESEIKSFTINMEINPMSEVEKHQEKLSIMKGHMPLRRLFFLGFLAGWWIGLSTILVVTVAGGVPVDVRKAWPMLPKIITGVLFPFAIFFISLFGGELFTGNSMVMLIGLMAGRITIFELLYNWSVVLVSNFTGCVTTVYFFGYLTHLFDDEPWRSYIAGIAEYKIHLAPEVVFLRAITANALVCICILFGYSARDMLGKMAGMWFPVLTFATSGFEHAIANMASVPLGLMYGADTDYRVWLYQNLIIAILGNVVGGGFIVGGAEYFLFDWTKVIKNMQSQRPYLTQPQPSEERERPVMPPTAGPSHADALFVYGTSSYEAAAGVPEEDRVRQVFGMFDTDRDGALAEDELMCALHVLGYKHPKPLVAGMLAAHAASDGLLHSEGLIEVTHRLHELEHLGLSPSQCT